MILDYSTGSGWGDNYSIKVYDDGSMYLKTNSLMHLDSLWVKKGVNVYKLNSMITKAESIDLAKRYEQEGVQDASFFNFIFYNNEGKLSKHYVYGNSSPKSLMEIRNYCDSLNDATGWTYLKDTLVTFSSIIDIKYKIDSNMRFLPPLPLPVK